MYIVILSGNFKLPDTKFIHSWLLWKAIAIWFENFGIDAIIFSRYIGAF